VSLARSRHPSESWDLRPSERALAARDPSFRWGDGLMGALMCVEARGAGPRAHPAAQSWYLMGGRMGVRAGTASAAADKES